MKKKLLLTGASGFLGWNICALAKNEWEITGSAHSKFCKIEGVEIITTDLTKTDIVREIFANIQPDAVIHTAAISDANYCQQHPSESYSINVNTSTRLAEECAKLKIPFVFTSTDLVFDGLKGNYTEADTPNPVSEYGKQKIQAEQMILDIYPQSAICRMPLMLGDSGPVALNYLERVLRELRKNKKLTLFTDEFRSPLGGYSAAKGLLLALEKFQGIYHLGGAEKMSRYELGLKIAKTFGFSKSLIVAAKQADLKMAAPRPPDVSLDSSKATSMEFLPLTIDEELQSLSRS